MYVLSGVAGAGKSTIAYEFARRLESKGRLGATFFFVRGSEKLSTTSCVIPSIAYQLAWHQPKLRRAIVDAVRAHVGLEKRQDLQFQLDELIVKPLTDPFPPVTETQADGPSHSPPTVIVIDALDECEGSAQDEVRRLLYLLQQSIQKLHFPLRILFTTRPELHIEDVLNSYEFRRTSKPFKLHDVPRSTADNDIVLYLRTSIARSNVEPLRYLTRERPHATEDLAKAADGLFIYAFTALDFLSRSLYPEQAVEKYDMLLSSAGSSETNSELDKLYLSVLQTAFSEPALKDSRYLGWMQDVLGAIALFADHVAPSVLAPLIDIAVNKIHLILKHLGSLVISGDDPKNEIRPLHASFPQFLIDDKRCTNKSFFVDAPSGHARIAFRCLQILIAPNALGVGKTVIPPHLQYSCLHWATHLANAAASADLCALLAIFVREYLLLWFETLSHLGRLEVAAPALLLVRDWYKVRIAKVYCILTSTDSPGQPHCDTVQTLLLLNDGYRFILEFFDPIQADPKHIYISALPFTPCCTLREIYIAKSPSGGAVRMKTALPSQWSPCLRTMEGHGKSVCFVRFSPDGHHVASASWDNTVRTWDTRSGIPLNVIQHEEPIRAVTFCPNVNVRQLVTGCNDGFVRIWDFASGALQHKLGPTGDQVTAVVYSPDGKRILAGDDSGGLYIWNVVDEESPFAPKLECSLSSSIWSVAFSPDGTVVLAVSDDTQIWTWDGYTFGLKMALQGHSEAVTNAVFTHDGRRIVSGSRDGTVRIWDVNTGRCIKILAGVLAPVYAVAVTATFIAAGSSKEDPTIRLWDAETYEPLGILTGHTNDINSLSFSPDEQQLVVLSQLAREDIVGRCTAGKPQRRGG